MSSEEEAACHMRRTFDASAATFSRRAHTHTHTNTLSSRAFSARKLLSVCSTCVYVCVRVCLCVRVYIYSGEHFRHASNCACVPTCLLCLCVCARTHTHIHKHTHTRECIHSCVCVYIHMYTLLSGNTTLMQLAHSLTPHFGDAEATLTIKRCS
jgi:hypothetical protein